jgi:predicted phage terminase large subunit-like protein
MPDLEHGVNSNSSDPDHYLRAQALTRILTREAAQAFVQRARAELARRSLYEFFRQAWATLEPGAPLEDGEHIGAICQHVQWQLEDRAAAVAWLEAHPGQELPPGIMRAQNFLINVPPRCLKSKIISACATAWAWIKWPHLRILALSTNPRVATRDSGDAFKLITSSWYQRAFILDPETGAPAWTITKSGETHFANSAGGTRLALGTRATLIGEGADWIIIDDPHDATDSADVMVKAVEDYTAAIHGRVNSPTCSIRTGVMQRLSELDWSAEMLRQGWAALILPMELELERVHHDGQKGPYETVYGWKDWRTEEGQRLHTRFTGAFLATERTRLGSLSYAGQFQQAPAPSEGGSFKRAHWNFWRPEGTIESDRPRPTGCHKRPARIIPLRGGRPAFDQVVISVDAAFVSNDKSDSVGLLVVGCLRADRFVMHDGTKRMTFNETLAAIRALRVAYPYARKIIIERKANGDAIIDTLATELGGVVGILPKGGKSARAEACGPCHEGGNLYLLEGAAWLDAFVGELAVFPNGAHDDRVDALTQLLIELGLSLAMSNAIALGTL